MVRLADAGYIFRPYVFSGGISSDRACCHYVEPLPETPHISSRRRGSVDRDLAQIEPDIGTLSKSRSAICVIGLKRVKYVTAIGGVRHLPAPLTMMELAIQRESAQ